MARKKNPLIYPILESDGIQKRRDQIQLEKSINFRTNKEIENELSLLPTDRLEWELFCRPTIKGKLNRIKYFPMLTKIIEDRHPFKLLRLARQWGKTTIVGSELAYTASTNYDYDLTYFNFKIDNLRTFSNSKFRQDIFGQGPLSKYIKSTTNTYGSVSKVELFTRSIIDMILPGVDWSNALGKSNHLMAIDEGQEIEWTGFSNARETQADTMGDLLIAGVGCIADSDYDKIWKSTNQMDYKFRRGEEYGGLPNMSWRADLEFNKDEPGILFDEYLLDVLDGDYIPQQPKPGSRHGYLLTQLQNPRIPLTKLSAVEDYKVSEEFSIEYKLEDMTNVDYRINVLAESVEGELKPITYRMMNELFDSLVFPTRADDVNYGDGNVYVSIDWGGAFKTIIWVWQCINPDAPIFKLLWVERIESNDTKEQERICCNFIDDYDPDFIGIDAQGAPDRVQAIQKRYGIRSVRITYHARPEFPVPTKKEFRKQKKEMRYVIDRTYSINRLIDLIKHPYHHDGFSSPRIILPGGTDNKNNWREKLEWIIPQFTCIEGEYVYNKTIDRTLLSYLHKNTEPDDALQACNYGLIAWDIHKTKGLNHFTANIDYEPGEQEDFSNLR